MAYSSEIEKLRARYNENPKGRNFAPLADAYRKAKQLDEAIALCREGLEHHPDYVSAHIVLGRCLIDKGDDPAAAESLRRVLELDPENIIALRLLSDIALRQQRPAEAVDWLTRLLHIDPMNGEAGELLSLARARMSASPAEAPGADGDAGQAGAAPAPLATTITELPAVSAPGVRPPLRVSPSAPTTPILPLGVPSGAATSDEAAIDFSGVDDAAEAAPTVDGEDMLLEPAPETMMPTPELARMRRDGSGLFTLDTEASRDPAPRASAMSRADLPLIMPDDVAAAGPARTASAPPAAPRASSDDQPVPPLLAFPDDDGAADRAALSQAEPLVTETMAELYLRQGHVDEALGVYRALLEQRPADEQLRAKVDSLASPRSAGAAGPGGRGSRPTALEFLHRVFGGDRTAPPVVLAPVAPPSASEAVLDQVFAEAGAESDEGPAGAPTRPATDALSLDNVFGEQSQESPPAGHGVEKSAAVGAPAGFSFDDFFSSTEPAQAEPADGTPAGSRPGGRPSRPAEAEQDLDQFQAWLRSLKS